VLPGSLPQWIEVGVDPEPGGRDVVADRRSGRQDSNVRQLVAKTIDRSLTSTPCTVLDNSRLFRPGDGASRPAASGAARAKAESGKFLLRAAKRFVPRGESAAFPTP